MTTPTVLVKAKSALTSKTILFNLPFLLLGLNELIPLLSEYSSVLAISDAWVARLTFVNAAGNILLRRFATVQPVSFTKPEEMVVEVPAASPTEALRMRSKVVVGRGHHL